ncbi:MAG: molybdopterin-synthase adenylyltransferase MoeB [Vicingus serpentipes]|nr:molybdopterin-synthase adenylyltransferase MoeB [Vicingus serpentipes]
MNLTDKEKNRYNRHILLDKVGLEGQEKLKAAKVLVIGAGGLGCPVLQYLTAAGVGTIGLIDFDVVDESNLQRQILFTTADVGKLKVEAAKEKLSQQNPLVQFDVYPEKLTTSNALSIFSKYDIVIDGTDNFSTRYLVNDACVITGKPLVYGAIYKFEGQVSVFNHKGGPSYRCLFPEPPKAGSVPSCSDVGVIGVLPGLIGTQQANEAIKIILEIGVPLSGKLQTYNALNNAFMMLNVKRSEEQINKIINESANFETFDYDFFCGVKQQNTISKEIAVDGLKELYEKGIDFQVVDVRGEWEQPRIEKGNVLIAPLDELDEFVSQIAKDKQVVVVCQKGIRSRMAIEQLENEYNYNNLINLEGGIVNW